MLKSRGSVHWPRVPQFGQAISPARPAYGPSRASNSSSRWSARNRLWQDRHSVSGSVKTPTWPDATQTWRGRMTEESRPTMSSRAVTTALHHCRLMFSLSSTPSGP